MTKKRSKEDLNLRVSPNGRTPNQKNYIKSMQNNDMVFCSGPPGTGKTHLAVGMALNYLFDDKVDRILIARPVVTAGEELGFLKGDINDKMDPFVRPAFDELESFIDCQAVSILKNDRKIEIVPVAFMRGRTFKDAFIVVDECQNLDFDQMKMTFSRTGMQSKMVFTGDINQSDLHIQKRGAFRFACELFKNIDNIGVVELDKSDIQRHPLVGEMVDLWEKHVDLFRSGGKIN